MVYKASDLGLENVLRDVHDPLNQALRTTATAVVPPGSMEVIIDYTDDSIQVKGPDGSAIEPNADGSINVKELGVSTPLITNIAVPLANNEMSFTFPLFTKRFTFNVLGDSKAQFSYIPGQSGTNFKTIYPGNEYKETDLTLTGPLTIYFRLTKAGQKVEILSWA